MVLRDKFRLGLFDNPYNAPREAVAEAGADKHRDFVLDIQRQSLVLLKNEDKTLPLDKKKTARVLVAGPLADEDNFMISRYGPNDLPTVTVLDGIRNYLGDGAEVRYAKGCDVVDAGFPDSELTATPLTAAEPGRHRRSGETGRRLRRDRRRAGRGRRARGREPFAHLARASRTPQQLLEALHATASPWCWCSSTGNR